MKKTLILLLFFLSSCSLGTRTSTINIPQRDENILMGQFSDDVLKYVFRCNELFDVNRLAKEAKKCSDEIYPMSVEYSLPACYVISADSKSVFVEKNLNYIIKPIVIVTEAGATVKIAKIVGFYIGALNIMVLVDNFDVEKIYKHEIQHHILRKKGIKETSNEHGDLTWGECSEPYFEPSKRAKILHWFYRFSKLFS